MKLEKIRLPLRIHDLPGRRAVKLLGALLGAMVLCSPGRAAAQAASTPHVHDGFYLRLGLGAGYLGADVLDKQLGDGVEVQAFAWLSELAIGGTVWKGLVVGGGSFNSIAFGPVYEGAYQEPQNGYSSFASTGGFTTIGLLAPFVDYYPWPERGAHGQLALGLSSMAAGKSPYGSGASKYPPGDASGFGWGLMVGGGYEVWLGEQWSLGGILRFTYAQATLKASENANYEVDAKPYVFGALATLTYH